MIEVTVVGAGHYARNIIARKYAALPQCRLRSVLTPRTTLTDLANTPLGNVPLVRSVAEWTAQFGAPSPDDLFDLCVHVDSMLPILRRLLDIGASKFVLPKPIATTAEDLNALERLVETSGAWVTVASQWHFSEVTRSLRSAMLALGSLANVTAVFSQNFTPHQLAHYTPATALLPHMLQILHTAELWTPHPNDSISVGRAPHHWRIEINAASGTCIDLETDLRHACQTRRFAVGAEHESNVVVADFLGVFREGEAVRFPSLNEGERTREIREDNIGVMADAVVTAAGTGASCLTLEDYRPVADMLLRIIHA